jgi:fructose-bisphosphate aldolase class 1
LCNALGELIPSYTFRAKVVVVHEYTIAEVVTLKNSTNEPDELVGVVKTSGDPPWDAAKAVLSALNRRLGYLILDSYSRA